MFSNVFATLKPPFAGQPQLAAIFYILISTTAFSGMNVAVRLLAADFHPTLIVALRTLVTLAMLTPWVLHHGPELLHTPRLRTHMLRGFVGGVGMIGWTYSVSILPVTHATALSFTAPLFVSLLAILLLSEQASWQRWLALGIGFIGTLVILRPSAEGFDARSLVVIATSFVWAITGILVKQLSATEPPLRMVFYMNLFMLLLTAPLASFHLQMPDWRQWGILVLISACSLLMHLSMVRAYALAPLVTLMPFDFTRLVSTSLFAYLLFGETSDAYTWVGAFIIITAAIISARRDAKAVLPSP